MSNNQIVKQIEKTDCSSDINQIANNFNQLYLKDNNTLNIFGEIVKELYNLYYEERLKGKRSEQIPNILDQFLTKRDLLSFGKWIEKDEHKYSFIIKNLQRWVTLMEQEMLDIVIKMELVLKRMNISVHLLSKICKDGERCWNI
ncbi:hypothetical protein C2G38_2205419 [Gigaspora rosea]|uniref:Uncharacterized protein n=1 Tax=Gigaspora rosea TaxID=44941 RepID=A0A397UT97_9GLOM|nr:hypothetical protein C2G38_2205419 [Gigaspora rosea]